jgi:hypothetical protein
VYRKVNLTHTRSLPSVRMFLRSYVGYQEVEDEGDIVVDEGLILTGTLHTLGDLEAGE